MNCKNCSQRGHCRHICEKLEAQLLKLNKYSLKSNYIIKFLDPQVMDVAFLPEEIGADTHIVPEDIYFIVKKSLCVLTATERYYITRYYGLINAKYVTQVELAKRKKVSQHTVYIHLKKGRIKLKKELSKYINYI